MRDLKFRAWDDEHNTGMFYPLEWFFGNVVKAKHPAGKTIRVIPMQYTGLKDRNGKEIYEGDLFGESNSDGVEVFGEVYFDTDFAGFCVKYPNGGWTTLGEHLLEKRNHREVIGNIYEHKHLLEVGDA